MRHETPPRATWTCDPNAIKVVIPASVISLRAKSFVGATQLQAIHFERGSRVSRFHSDTFCHCRSLKSLSIPPSVEILGATLFSRKNRHNWPLLETVIFEPGSKPHTIESYAFNKCVYLKSLCLPTSLSQVDGLAFADSGLTTIEVEQGSEFLFVENDCLMDLKRPRIIRYFGSSNQIAIPDAIEELAPGAFAGHLKLIVTVSPHSKLRSMSAHAFHGCRTLSSILIPSFVIVIDDECFSKCSGLVTVTFAADSELRTIGRRAFWLCRVESIALPSSVDTLGVECFLACHRLVTITFAADSKLRRIEQGAFGNCEALRAFSLPASVEFVGERCFAGDDALTTFEFGVPAHVRELRNLPRELDGRNDIPDSVEVIALACPSTRFSSKSPRNPRCHRTLAFGRESRLREIVALPRGDCSSCFLQVPTRALKTWREDLEFGKA
jgi:hypothetical protein